MFTPHVNEIFRTVIADYHLKDDIDALAVNPYPKGTLDHLLYLKCWIDTVQWHLEDIIRDPEIDPAAALTLKRRIDGSNQLRCDVVEMIDQYMLDRFSDIKPNGDARINTETPAWAIDRLSILSLKIFHMEREVERPDAAPQLRDKCRAKLDILRRQQADLSQAIDDLLDDIAAGRKYMKVYRQMKMYNDPQLNPVLYAKK